MNRMDYYSLLSEKNELEKMVARIPAENVIDRMSLESRLDDVKAELSKHPFPVREPARVKITFNGGPVLDGYG
ncbi:MAG: hypothetical protein JW795_06220, partial [Chitinivibrionales bacterium]|nr:hypothetical protein [Chitinivibrionales bacterium]